MPITGSGLDGDLRRYMRPVPFVCSRMKPTSLIAAAVFLASPVIAQTGQPQAKAVDASKFPSLQAAFDAVPAAGGIVAALQRASA